MIMATGLPQNFTFSGDGKNSLTTWSKGKQIGGGAFSKVYLAKIFTSRGPYELAVKHIKTTQEAKDKYEKSALTEINALRNLSHERIVRYHGFCAHEFSFYIFMEYVQNGSLFKFIKKNGPLANALLKKLTKQILTGLQYLHSKRIIHRDIKSDNVLMIDQDNIKLADFGVSKMFDDISKAYTSEVGTKSYMAPEMFDTVSHSYPVDIWATGCVVLEMATGKRPFDNFEHQQLYKILDGENPSPMIYTEVSKEIETFLFKIFYKDPLQRPNCVSLLRDTFLKDNEYNDIEELLEKTVRNPSESEDDLGAFGQLDNHFDKLSDTGDEEHLINSVINRSWDY